MKDHQESRNAIFQAQFNNTYKNILYCLRHFFLVCIDKLMSCGRECGLALKNSFEATFFETTKPTPSRHAIRPGHVIFILVLKNTQVLTSVELYIHHLISTNVLKALKTCHRIQTNAPFQKDARDKNVSKL